MSIVGIYVDVETESIYFFKVHIDDSSASSTNFLHVSFFALLRWLLYTFNFSFDMDLSSSLFDLIYRFLSLFADLRSVVNSSFHHFLLKGTVRLRGVVSEIAHVIALVIAEAREKFSPSPSTPLPVFLSLPLVPFVLLQQYIAAVSFHIITRIGALAYIRRSIVWSISFSLLIAASIHLVLIRY